MFSPLLQKCLDDLEERIDESQEEANWQAWMDFWDGRTTENIFTPPVRRPNPPRVNWPKIPVNQAIGDDEAMLLSQFASCSAQLDGGNLRLCVRCNYGTGILPSLFGCELFMMPPETDTLPACKPLSSRDQVLALLDRGVPDLNRALGGNVFSMAGRFLEVFARYPKIARHVRLYHPDTQGPIDVAEVVWGSDIFYAFYDDTQLLRDLLNLITETYLAFMRRWFELVPPVGPYAVHWSLVHRGAVMLRNDSLMNLSPETYREYVRPLDQRIFDALGGGAIHFCGRGDHFIADMAQMRGLSAINLSQPHLNDMSLIYRHTVDRGIRLIGFSREAAEQAHRPLLGRVQV